MTWRVRLAGRLGALVVALEFESDASIVCVVGPNGAGKTTLLRAIAGAPLGLVGRVEVGAHTLLDSARGVDVPPEARRVGYVPQGFGLFPHLDVEANVAFGARDPAAVEAAMERFSVTSLRARSVGALSGGERQRVALARAVASRPACLLLDEPLSALDARTRRAMRGFLAEDLAREGTPTLVVTHDARDVRALGGELVAVEAGRVVQRGAPEAVAARPAHPFLEELFDIG